MTDQRRKEMLRAIEEIEMHGPSRDDMKVRIPVDTWISLRDEARETRSHPGEKWTESHEAVFWDARLDT